MSISNIRSYVAFKNSSIITLDEVDSNEVKAVDDKKRKDFITKRCFDSVNSMKIRTYLSDFLKKKQIDINDLDHSQITFGEFWDFQVEVYKHDEMSKEKKIKEVAEFSFSEDYMEALHKFYEDHDKKKEFNEFIKNIPNGLIKQPLNEFFGILTKIVSDRNETVVDEIKGRRLKLDRSDQDKWKTDAINFLYRFEKIEELNHESFYKDELLKPGTFINTLFYIEEKGVGRGELLICYLYSGAVAQGGSMAYDVVLLNGKKYEVKEYVGDRSGIRLGTEGKLLRFNFWKDIEKTISVATQLFEDYKDELKKYLPFTFYKMWYYVIDDKKKGDSFSKAVAAGVKAGELGNANMNILKMWYYLAHELVIINKYSKITVPEEVANSLSKLHYVSDPLKLDDDLEDVSNKYFEQNPELDSFIVFRPDKVNIVEKGGFKYYLITQAAVKFLETELSTKTDSKAKIAFRQWKEKASKTIEEFKTSDDKYVLQDAVEKLSYKDFYDNLIYSEHEKKYSETSEKETKKKHANWLKRHDQMEKSLDKYKTEKSKEKCKTTWLMKNPNPFV